VALETTLVFLARDRFSLDNRHFGLVLVYLGVVVIAIQGGVVGRLSRRLGERAVAILGAGLMGLALAVLPAAPRLVVLLVLLGLVAAGQASPRRRSRRSCPMRAKERSTAPFSAPASLSRQWPARSVL